MIIRLRRTDDQHNYNTLLNVNRNTGKSFNTTTETELVVIDRRQKRVEQHVVKQHVVEFSFSFFFRKKRPPSSTSSIHVSSSSSTNKFLKMVKGWSNIFYVSK